MGYAWEGKQECGCDLMSRCDKHAKMAEKLYEVWSDTSEAGTARFLRVWNLSDGYGYPGEVPPQGYDWSGIRDSTIEAVEDMYAEAIR